MITAKLTLKVHYIGMFCSRGYIENWLAHSCTSDKKYCDINYARKHVTFEVVIKEKHMADVKKYSTHLEIICDDNADTKAEIKALKKRLKLLENML